jgi:hypothetical protein
MLKFKPEVRISYFDDRLGPPLAGACLWSLRNRIEVEVSAIEDGPGVHLSTSLHSAGLAVDLDTTGDKAANTQALAEFLRRWLPPGYDVLFEINHVHVEYDPHRPAILKLP